MLIKEILIYIPPLSRKIVFPWIWTLFIKGGIQILEDETFQQYYFEPKKIVDKVRWKQKNNSDRYKIKVKIESNILEGTYLQLSINRKGIYALNITYEHLDPFVRWDTAHDNGNSFTDHVSKQLIDGPHKHKFDNKFGQYREIIPEGEITRHNVDTAFWQFHNELNIECNPENYVLLEEVKNMGNPTILGQFYSGGEK